MSLFTVKEVYDMMFQITDFSVQSKISQSIFVVTNGYIDDC